MIEAQEEDPNETWIEVPEKEKRKFLCIGETDGIFIRMYEGKVLVCITPNSMVKRKIIHGVDVEIKTFDPIGQNDGMDIVKFLATVGATKEKASVVSENVSRRIVGILDFLSQRVS